MKSIRYSARRFAEVLGLSPQELSEAESRGPLARMRAESPQRTMYTVDDLARSRAALGRQPARRPMRRQLFLNFKGGTGKTSLSASYAYRLAEMGYRVLVLDLDSQGHATKCLGKEGASFPHTLVVVRAGRTVMERRGLRPTTAGTSVRKTLSVIPGRIIQAPSPAARSIRPIEAARKSRTARKYSS